GRAPPRDARVGAAGAQRQGEGRRRDEQRDQRADGRTRVARARLIDRAVIHNEPLVITAACAKRTRQADERSEQLRHYHLNGPVAQRESRGLLIPWWWVRIPPGSPM